MWVTPRTAGHPSDAGKKLPGRSRSVASRSVQIDAVRTDTAKGIPGESIRVRSNRRKISLTRSGTLLWATVLSR